MSTSPRRRAALASRTRRTVQHLPRTLRTLLTNEIIRGTLAWLVGGALGSMIAERAFSGTGELPEFTGPAFGAWIGFAAIHALATWVAFRAREG
ncbi:MAG: hypothetical protein Q4G46_12990, partial [Propionibacteriaceae bacterium]|nr:hypothetical protein [Propionibacteriaceae bacterium]